MWRKSIVVIFEKILQKSRCTFSRIKKAAKSGNMPKIGGRNIDIYATTHEFAHTLSEALTTRLYGYGKEVEFWDEIEEIYKDYKKNGNGVLGKYAASN